MYISGKKDLNLKNNYGVFWILIPFCQLVQSEFASTWEKTGPSSWAIYHTVCSLSNVEIICKIFQSQDMSVCTFSFVNQWFWFLNDNKIVNYFPVVF